MTFWRKTFGALALALLLSCAAAAQDKTTGAVKGKVKVDSSSTPAGVAVIVRQGDTEVRRVETNAKGEFLVQGLAPGLYGVTFRKPGLSIATLEKIEVRAGKTRSVGSNVFLPVDTGSLAFIRGSVFNEGGRSVPGAQVELALIQPDGSAKKIDARVTNETGFFVFRLTPDHARYRVTVKAEGMAPAAQEVEIEGMGRTNIAITVHPAAK